MIVDKQLVVSNRKKVEIVLDLRKHKFRPFPKVKSMKTAGETEPAAEDEDAEDAEPDANGTSLADYDYLLGMPIWSLTKEKITKLNEQAADKEQELFALLEKTPVDLWNTDLDVFLKEWEVCGLKLLLLSLSLTITFIQNDCLDFEEKAVKDAKGKKVKKKQAVLRTRKSIGQGRGSDDDDDDFKPVKATAAAKRKPAATTETRKASSSKGKEKAKVEEDDDEMLPLVKEAAVPKKKAGAQKKTYVVVDDDDEEEEEYGEVTAAAKKKTATRKVSDAPKKEDIVVKEAPPAKKTAAALKKMKVLDEDALSEEYDILPKAKGKKMQVLDEDGSSEEYKGLTKAKGKQAKKKQVVESDSGSELEIIEKPNKEDTKGKRKR